MKRDELGRIVDDEGRTWWVDRLTLPGVVRLRWARPMRPDEGEHERATHGAQLANPTHPTPGDRGATPLAVR